MEKKPAKDPFLHEMPEKMGFWRKLWWFIWEDNSIWSWLVNIVLAFVIIKFLVYPGLGLALGTSYPIVAVVSGSMEHETNFDLWWTSTCACVNAKCDTQADLYAKYTLTKDQFERFKFPNGFNKGDIMILIGAKNVQPGDVVVFGVQGMSDPIIHRVVAAGNTSVTTKGDHNCGSASFEHDIPQHALVGKAAVRVPLLGWIKILAVELLNVILGRA
ncbi:MAG TPA: hypothetical protein VLJ21_01785 [Candidatus Binatia bacterium]|nr:hypothetical protein [Candidatus Binatia bacterium]